MIQRYSLYRRGAFSAVPGGNLHCGNGTTRFWYSCLITVTSMDQRGFVLEHLDLDRRIRASAGGKIVDSCELACLGIVRLAESLLLEADLQIVSITVKCGTDPGDSYAMLHREYSPETAKTA